MIDIYVKAGHTIPVGRKGEHDARKLIFDCNDYINNLGEGIPVLLVKLPDAADPYPAMLNPEGSGMYSWIPNESDTSIAGWGSAELDWYSKDGESLLAKVLKLTTSILPAICDCAGDPPDPYESWVERLAALGVTTNGNAETVKKIYQDFEKSAGETEKELRDMIKEIPGEVEDAKKHIDGYVTGKEQELKGDTGNMFFAAFKVVNGRLIMYSDPTIDKVRFARIGSRLVYRLEF